MKLKQLVEQTREMVACLKEAEATAIEERDAARVFCEQKLTEYQKISSAYSGVKTALQALEGALKSRASDLRRNT